jgi:hypothetical protein
MKRLLTPLLLILLHPFAQAQYAPQAGVAGSDAIHKSSSSITAWATQCSIQRGWQDIADPTLGRTSTGDSTMAIGPADGSIISLGDSGIAVLQFAQPIYNGTGTDFAVFENGFTNPANPEEAFLELAFVEVSSDGEHFFRFPSISNTSTSLQIAGSGMYMNARLLHNLAGKYVSQYGTPFNLDDLAGTIGLDINNITHIRIIDVIGDISSHASLDANGHKINDPYPTNFATGGFDLDAVAVIHQKTTGITNIDQNLSIRVYPNPTSDYITIDTKDNNIYQYSISDITGRLILGASIQNPTNISLLQLPNGLYYITLSNSQGNKWIGKISKL